VNGNGSSLSNDQPPTLVSCIAACYSKMKKFGELTFGELKFGYLTFGEMTTVGEMTFGEMLFGEMTFGDLTFGEPTGHHFYSVAHPPL